MEHVLFMCCQQIQVLNEPHSSAVGILKTWVMLACG